MNSSYDSIFVVDDDESVRRSICRLLKSFDMPAQAFSSAGEFLAEIPFTAEGCLILDMRMPFMSGLDLQNRLLDEKSPLGIIFISAHESPREVDIALKRGALGFLQKPFREDELLSLIQRYRIGKKQ
ncbi:MAG: response regulator transcription factor [Candidatus Xenobiia bacterium LiM19]